MSRFSQLFFGRASFQESEEYAGFQFKFLCVVLVSGAAFTFLFLLGIRTKLNDFSGPHVASMVVFTTIAILLWLILRGKPQRFAVVAWCYELICLLEYCSALVYVPSDAMRVFWFATNIPGVYILLGQRAGLIISTLSIVGLAVVNPYLSAPYSQNALATTLIGLAYIAMFFHVYGDRSISYFHRLQASNRQLQHMASHDALTGVLNARAYYANCDQLISLARRDSSPYTVLFVDLDHFKCINDTYGHAVGDAVLKAVAKALMTGVRQSDVTGRVGGEEFSVFLPQTDQAGGLILAETLRKTIEDLSLNIGGQHIRITASIGVAESQNAGLPMEEIQRQADQAMYCAKNQGRNRVSMVA